MELRPKAQRDDWQKLQGAARTEYVVKLRHEERRKHEQWMLARRFWRELEAKQPMPSKLGDYSPKVKTYVEEFLLPTLTPAEETQLKEAEGRWPDYPQALVAIASTRPAALPPDPPRKLASLPKSVQHRLVDNKKTGVPAKKLEKEVRSYEGPNFASNLVKHYPNKLPFEYEYLASNYNSLLKPMKDFVDNKLLPVLDQAEKRQLSDAEKKWPEYPLTIQ
jgi:hypothetical protein